MDKSYKWKILISLIFFTLLLMIISFGLSELVLSPGMPIPELTHAESGIAQTDVYEMDIIQKKIVPKSILIIILTIAAIVVIFIIIKKMNFSDLKSVLISIIPIILIILSIVGLYMLLIPNNAPEMIQEILPQNKVKPATTSIGKVPEILLWISGTLIFILCGAIVFRMLLLKKKNKTLEEAIENESLNAKKAIQHGENLKEIIIRYYQNLCMVLEEEQGIAREAFSTVKEFEKKLDALGAPESSVRHLTRLFEEARYGNWKPLPGSDEKAVKSFDDIINYFRANRGNENHEKK